MERVFLDWCDIGELISLSLQQLECLAREHRDIHADCCRAVLGSWLDDPPEEYPITWSGLIELLQDSELTQIVSELKNALSKSNIEYILASFKFLIHFTFTHPHFTPTIQFF